jgi:CRP/FNR family transcriptional regulator, anaerobic regulatory protein
MVEDRYLSLLEEAYSFIFEEGLLAEIAKVGRFQKVKEGSILIELGQRLSHMPLLISGAVKILREDAKGDELLLYYLERGDTCAMSFSCCMGAKKSRVRAVVEEDSELIMIPIEYMDSWLSEFPTWKSYVFQSIDARMEEFLESIDSIAFMRMDERLAKYLRDKVMVTGSMEVKTTHQEIASDLHTSRVVISRLLKQLENQGLLSISRNKITLLTMDVGVARS